MEKALPEGEDLPKAVDKRTGNTNKWIFRGATENRSIYNEFEGGKFIEMVNPTHVVATMSPNKYRIPRELEMIHAYHPKYEKLIEFNERLSIESLSSNVTNKVKLLVNQKGKCKMCGLTLLGETGEFAYDGTTNIHHIVARTRGGKKAKLSNMALVHATCHQKHDHLLRKK